MEGHTRSVWATEDTCVVAEGAQYFWQSHFKRTQMKQLCALIALLGLTACGSGENDPIYQALKANPPTEIPERHLPKLRRGIVSCDVFQEGTPKQYMTCWWPYSGSDPHVAYYSYYGGGLRRPHPSNLSVPGGKSITEQNYLIK